MAGSLRGLCMGVCDGNQDRHTRRHLHTPGTQTLPATPQAASHPEGSFVVERATRIALLARRYRLLAERPELLTASRAELIERMLAAQVAIGEFDRTLILHASELDRLCAHAVRSLARRAPGAVLDVLGVLHADRLAAMYYALPDGRREAVRRDPAWSYQVEHVPPGTDEAVAEVERCAQDAQQFTARLAALAAQAPRSARESTERWDRSMLRHEVGLPVLLTDPERELIAQADEDTARRVAVMDVFTDELAALPDRPDDETFAAACARAVERCRG